MTVQKSLVEAVMDNAAIVKPSWGNAIIGHRGETQEMKQIERRCNITLCSEARREEPREATTEQRELGGFQKATRATTEQKEGGGFQRVRRVATE